MLVCPSSALLEEDEDFSDAFTERSERRLADGVKESGSK